MSTGEPGAFIDSVVIDEAAQLTEAETAIVFSNELSRLVLVGDPKQLPSTVISNLSKGLMFGRSLFERLESQGHPTSMFTVQVYLNLLTQH
jgi:senataxin